MSPQTWQTFIARRSPGPLSGSFPVYAAVVLMGKPRPGAHPRKGFRGASLPLAVSVEVSQVPGDHDPLDLVRPLDDLHHLCIAHVTLDRVLASVAITTEHLDAVRR